MSLFSIIVILLFFLSLIQSHVTFVGASSGLILWFQTLVPTLFPYMIFSALIVRTRGLDYLGTFLGSLFQKLFHVSSAGSFAVISGFLCGYPMGARVTADLVLTGRITHEEGNYLLTFTNNTSPAFIINFLCAAQLKESKLTFVFLGILYISAYLTSLVFRRNLPARPLAPDGSMNKKEASFWKTIEVSIAQSIESITQIGGYIILFSVLIFQISNLTDDAILLSIGSFLEITNGIPLIIKEIPNRFIQYIILMALTSFGGVCSIIQTQGMISESGLSLRTYIEAKFIQAGIAGLLCFLWCLWIL